jgi:hypothetical protein
MTGDLPASRSPRHDAIQEAVDAVTSREAGYPNVKYRISGTALAEVWRHEIDLSSVPPERSRSASITVIVALAQRGFVINAVDPQTERLHVVYDGWFDHYRGVRPDELDADLSVLDDLDGSKSAADGGGSDA